MNQPLSVLKLTFDAPTHLIITQKFKTRTRIVDCEFPKTEKAAAIGLRMIKPSPQDDVRIEFGVGTRTSWATYYTFQIRTNSAYSETIHISFSEGQPFVLAGKSICLLVERRDDCGKT